MEDLFLLQKEGLKESKLIERLNRFTLKVRIGSKTEKVYLRNSGALSTVLSPDRTVLLEKVNGENRKTRFNVFAIKIKELFVTVDSILPNKIFPKILDKGLLPELKRYKQIIKEPRLPEHGKADFLLEKGEKKAYIEIKSCTHVENRIAKFPDRPTKRGRRHLENLTKLSDAGHESYIIFFVQRPDAEKFQPFKEIDPKFAALLKRSRDKGVNIKAFSTEFRPPVLFLKNRNLEVKLL